MDTVLVEDTNGVRRVTLNRPARRNALTPGMLDELSGAISGAGDARVLVLRGAGEAFCAGLDIAVLQGMRNRTAEEHHLEAERVSRALRALWECDVPTIAVVQGAAVAGGTGLATMCDFTLASPEARFGYTEARIGFVPALVSAYLRMQVGDKIARGLLLSARLFDAQEALHLGLVTEVVPREHLEARSAGLVAELLRNSPQSLRATKQLMRAQSREWLDAALEEAMQANAASRGTEDFCEGVSAFLEKRKPRWVPEV